VYWCGLVQAAAGAESSLQVDVTGPWASLVVNATLAVEPVVELGAGALIETVGLVRSIVQVRVTVGVVSGPFFARAEYVWLPSASPLRFTGLVQAVKAAPSSEHSNVLPDWVALSVIEAVVTLTIPLGAPVMSAVKSEWSTVQEAVPGALPFPAAS
jgi:hypothetical protein